jgi:hypothetical protein
MRYGMGLLVIVGLLCLPAWSAHSPPKAHTVLGTTQLNTTHQHIPAAVCACPAGHSLSVAECKDCPLCEECPIGTHNKIGTESCKPCPPGQTTNQTGSGEASDCRPCASVSPKQDSRSSSVWSGESGQYTHAVHIGSTGHIWECACVHEMLALLPPPASTSLARQGGLQGYGWPQ